MSNYHQNILTPVWYHRKWIMNLVYSIHVFEKKDWNELTIGFTHTHILGGSIINKISFCQPTYFKYEFKTS